MLACRLGDISLVSLFVSLCRLVSPVCSVVRRRIGIVVVVVVRPLSSRLPCRGHSVTLRASGLRRSEPRPLCVNRVDALSDRWGLDGT